VLAQFRNRLQINPSPPFPEILASSFKIPIVGKHTNRLGFENRVGLCFEVQGFHSARDLRFGHSSE
jgi:hypothetical protein